MSARAAVLEREAAAAPWLASLGSDAAGKRARAALLRQEVPPPLRETTRFAHDESPRRVCRSRHDSHMMKALDVSVALD
jgi:hypothetical protein